MRTPAWIVRPPGAIPYDLANVAMHGLAERRLAGEIPDTLILLEHPPVFTAGKRWEPAHLTWAEDAMRAAGAEFHLVDRGGIGHGERSAQAASAMITLAGPASGRRSSLRQPVCASQESASSSP